MNTGRGCHPHPSPFTLHPHPSPFTLTLHPSPSPFTLPPHALTLIPTLTPTLTLTLTPRPHPHPSLHLMCDFKHLYCIHVLHQEHAHALQVLEVAHKELLQEYAHMRTRTHAYTHTSIHAHRCSRSPIRSSSKNATTFTRLRRPHASSGFSPRTRRYAYMRVCVCVCVRYMRVCVCVCVRVSVRVSILGHKPER